MDRKQIFSIDQDLLSIFLNNKDPHFVPDDNFLNDQSAERSLSNFRYSFHNQQPRTNSSPFLFDNVPPALAEGP